MNILVNSKKRKQAEEILSWIEKAPKKTTEQNTAKRFADFIKKDKVAEKDQLEYVYGKLGGLIKTEAEEKKADKKDGKAGE